MRLTHHNSCRVQPSNLVPAKPTVGSPPPARHTCRVDARLLPAAHAVSDARQARPRVAHKEGILAAVVRLVGVRDVFGAKAQTQAAARGRRGRAVAAAGAGAGCRSRGGGLLSSGSGGCRWSLGCLACEQARGRDGVGREAAAVRRQRRAQGCAQHRTDRDAQRSPDHTDSLRASRRALRAWGTAPAAAGRLASAAAGQPRCTGTACSCMPVWRAGLRPVAWGAATLLTLGTRSCVCRAAEARMMHWGRSPFNLEGGGGGAPAWRAATTAARRRMIGEPRPSLLPVISCCSHWGVVSE